MDMVDDAITVATACGAGVGRFLAAALTDALGSGVPLVAVRDVPGELPSAQAGIEFVFADAGSQYQEVIRVGVERDGTVVSVQIIRRSPERCSAHHSVEHELRSAVQSGNSVSMLRWLDDPAAPRERVLAMSVSADHRLVVPLEVGASERQRNAEGATAEGATAGLTGEGQNVSRVAGGEPQIAPRSRPRTR